MRILWLAQSAAPTADPPGPEAGLFSLLLIGALLGIGLLVLIGLIAAWRNYIQRQRELEIEHEDRMADLPRPDAWSTAAQRIDPPEAESDEAHIAPGTDPQERFEEEDTFDTQDPDDDDDEFPFDLDGNEDDDDEGPLGQA